MPRLSTANDIINRAAVQCGLPKSNDPVGSTDETFVRLTELLNGAGQELVDLNPWQILQKPYQIVTTDLDTGNYDLPDDFGYMIDQTGWERSNAVPLGGPLSPQDWTYLKGLDLVSQTIYASFRLVDNKFAIYPQPPPVGLDINFEYISLYWTATQGDTTNRYDTIRSGSDLVLFDTNMTVRFLKCKFLESTGMDASSARMEFDLSFAGLIGKDVGSPVLNASNGSRGYPYLSPYRNTGDQGYGG